MRGWLFILLTKILVAPVMLLLTLVIWICMGIAYVSGLVLFFISPCGLPMEAIWLLGKVQSLKFTIQNFN